MTERNNGGPAFPHSVADASGSIRTHWYGMTLRDYFAAKAMQGYIANSGFDTADEKVARWAYETADAMLEARK